jgi:hypothetical protein
MAKVTFKAMGGGPKVQMKERADAHFAAVRQIVPTVQRVMLFDRDDGQGAFHPEPDNSSLAEWRRRNIENYLLVPDAWKRVVGQRLGPLFAHAASKVVDEFFAAQNLTLPPRHTWRDVQANVFAMVDGKRILFENSDSLFHQLQAHDQVGAIQRGAEGDAPMEPRCRSRHRHGRRGRPRSGGRSRDWACRAPMSSATALCATAATQANLRPLITR